MGVGLHGLHEPSHDLDLGNSGTAMRLLAGLLAGQAFGSRLKGDASLNKRPMQRVTAPLTQMGAHIQTSEGGTPPVSISPARGPLTPVDYKSPVASAQVKSCVLLAGLYADGTTCVSEPAATRDHTERMLQTFGCSVVRHDKRACVTGGGALTGCDIEVGAILQASPIAQRVRDSCDRQRATARPLIPVGSEPAAASR